MKCRNRIIKITARNKSIISKLYIQSGENDMKCIVRVTVGNKNTFFFAGTVEYHITTNHHLVVKYQIPWKTLLTLPDLIVATSSIQTLCCSLLPPSSYPSKFLAKCSVSRRNVIPFLILRDMNLQTMCVLLFSCK